MLTPMTPEELRWHRSMGLYKTQADMEKDLTRHRSGALNPLTRVDRVLKITLTTAPLVVDILPPVQYDIQGHDD